MSDSIESLIIFPISPHGGSGGVLSINSDTTAAQLIVGAGTVTVSTVAGTTTITGSGGGTSIPNHQIAFGTGSGITSSANLTYNDSTNVLATAAGVVAGFNGVTSPTHAIDVVSTVNSVSPPATVTVTVTNQDPTVIGVCTGAFGGDENQYNNDQAACTANGECSDPQYTDETTCLLNAGTWTLNTFTPTAGFAAVANGTLATYTIFSHTAAGGGLYSATGTSDTLTLGLDTDGPSIVTTQVDGSGSYTADGSNTFTYTVYSIYPTGLRSLGQTSASFTDNNNGQPFSVDISWPNPVTLAGLTGYYVLNNTTGNAQSTVTLGITDDGSWPAFSDPGISNIKFNVSWLAATGADFYNLSSNLLSNIQGPIAGLSFSDLGTPYFGGTRTPAAPNLTAGIYSDGQAIFKNTLTTEAPIRAFSHDNGSSYSQQWGDGGGNIRAYMSATGVLTADFAPISGVFSTFNITATGTLASSGGLTVTGNSALGGLAAKSGGAYSVPSTGFSITMPAAGGGYGAFALILNPAGTLATGSITLSNANQVDGQIVIFSSTQTITALTITDTFIGTKPTTIAANHGYIFYFHQAGPAWIMIGQM